MSKRVSASDAKNNFGGLLEDVAALGRVEIVRHGRVVAIMLSPKALDGGHGSGETPADPPKWSENHMIAPHLARAARIVRPPRDFNED